MDKWMDVKLRSGCCFLEKKTDYDGSVEYLVKWEGLQYSQTTLEDAKLIDRLFPEVVDEYRERLVNMRAPDPRASVRFLHLPQSFGGKDIRLATWRKYGFDLVAINASHVFSLGKRCYSVPELV